MTGYLQAIWKDADIGQILFRVGKPEVKVEKKESQIDKKSIIDGLTNEDINAEDDWVRISVRLPTKWCSSTST